MILSTTNYLSTQQQNIMLDLKNPKVLNKEIKKISLLIKNTNALITKAILLDRLDYLKSLSKH